ncbi:hypothetical protein ACVWXL_005759 [Bradyrhizobium sp. GM22.5]
MSAGGPRVAGRLRWSTQFGQMDFYALKPFYVFMNIRFIIAFMTL